MAMPALKDFALVGGTALSLQYGHRISIDLDLFSTIPFDNEKILMALQNEFNDLLDNRTANLKFGIFCFIDNIKVDFVKHPHPLLQPISSQEDIRFFSMPDIIAMKAQAILGRGVKKDFWDIAKLLEHFSVEDFASFHQQKYNTQNILISIPQALLYFADAEESEEPISLQNQTWDNVQTFIKRKVRDYLN